METEHGFAAVNNARIWYEIAGEGTPLVLVHGITLDHRMWDDQFAELAAHHRVLRYDLRGFGLSAIPDGPYRHVDDLAALLAHVGMDRVAVVGLSLGGMIVVDFALTYPEMVSALIPVDSVLGGHHWTQEWDAAVKPVWRAGRAGDLATAKALWLANGLFAPARRDPAVGARLERYIAEYSGWHWRNRDPEVAIEPTAAERLGEIAAPTFVIVGEHDVPDCLAIADRLAREIPDARKTMIPGVGHMANMEAPSAFNERLLAFLPAG